MNIQEDPPIYTQEMFDALNENLAAADSLSAHKSERIKHLEAELKAVKLERDLLYERLGHIGGDHA